MLKVYERYNEEFTDNLYKILGNNNNLIDKIANYITHQKLSKKPITYLKFNNIVENSGKFFSFRESIIYSIYSYNKGLLNEIYKTESFEFKDIKLNLQNKKFLNLIDKRKIIKSCF